MANKNEHMDDLDWFDEVDPLAELDEGAELKSPLPPIKNGAKPRVKKSGKRRDGQHKPKKGSENVREELSDEVESLEFTYKARRHEAVWIHDSLDDLFRIGWFSDVLRVVKGGKEASVYQVAGNETTGEEFIAAKIYRPRMFRNLRNDHAYRIGRANLDSDGTVIKDEGMLKAIMQKSSFGKNILHQSWIEYEYQTLQKLHEAGADVPRVFARGNNVILMEYIGSEVLPAPTLNGVNLAPSEVKPLFDRCIYNLDLMLEQNCIHGDFSAFNILYWEGELVVIDFPQVVAPDVNPNAWEIFERDVIRICEYFATQGLKTDPHEIAADLWRKHGHRVRPQADVYQLDDLDPEDRDYWEKYG